MARVLMTLAASMLLGAGMPARAAEAIFYSDAEEYWGWAAGYSYSRAEAEARKECETGGAGCQLAVECDGGYAAIASADDTAKGIGMACGFASAAGARQFAIIECLIASNALCWTESAFDTNGREISSESNLNFDMTWYAQVMLNKMADIDIGDPDGVAGRKTRGAIGAFQKMIGRQETGELDDGLFWRLLDATGGIQYKTEGFIATREKFLKESTYPTDQVYGHASEPYAETVFSRELARRSDEQRRIALATLLSVHDQPCSLPAKMAEPLPADGSGFWNVSCDEGDFSVMLGDPFVIVEGLGEIEIQDAPAEASEAPASGGPGRAGQ